MGISILSNWGRQMPAKKYYFYVSDPKIQSILDELMKNRMLSDIMKDVLSNGLEKQIKKRLNDLKKLGDMYKE